MTGMQMDIAQWAFMAFLAVTNVLLLVGQRRADQDTNKCSEIRRYRNARLGRM